MSNVVLSKNELEIVCREIYDLKSDKETMRKVLDQCQIQFVAMREERDALQAENEALKKVVEAARKADYHTRESMESVRNAIIELDAIQKAAISHEKREQQG